MKKIYCLLLTIISSVIQPVLGQTDFTFNIKSVPFSCYGSYTSMLEGYDKKYNTNNIMLNDLTGSQIWGDKHLLSIMPMQGDKPLNMNYKGTPFEIQGSSGNSKMTVYYETPRIIHCRLYGCNLKLYGNWGGDIFHLFHLSGEYKNTYIIRNKDIAVTILSGELDSDNNVFSITKDKDNEIEVVIEQYYSAFLPGKYIRSYEECIKKRKEEFNRWCRESMPDVDVKYNPGKQLASYINWSCIYEPRGNITRYGMSMSKHTMTYIWSWDHCFNSLCLSYKNPKLSWDQFMIMFDHQDQETGAIPDLISSMTTLWREKKPPIHGWILSELLKNYMPEKEELDNVYAKLSKWTEFWLKYRDEDGNGLPQYYSGADSGWDNGTSFDIGAPAESADLAAFLILQMEELSKIAKLLGLKDESDSWRNSSLNLLDKLVKELWNGNKFITRIAGTDSINEKSKSLMSYIPIILGKRLPKDIRQKLVSDLKKEGNLLTDYGLATESPTGELYIPKNWRGNIWAPSTLIIIYGLSECGEDDFAQNIAKRFCDNCQKYGMSEQFDALTGKPLCDPTYTWTSSVFLVLAHKYLY